MSAGPDLQRVLNTLGHDLRGPLFTAQGFLQLLLPRTEGKAHEHAQYALESIEEAARMVNGVLQWARTDPHRIEMASVDLEETLEGIKKDLASLARRRQSRIEVDGLPSVRGDARALRYALQHLIDNAIRYGPEGQTIFVRGDSDDADWWIEIREEGPGVEDPAPLRAPFWEAEGRASGAGIALADRVASLHGGDLDFQGGTIRLSGRQEDG